MKHKTFFISFFSVIGVALITFFILHLASPKAQPQLMGTASVSNNENKQRIHYTAIGDSLTEGVGDATQNGGFVSLVADNLQEDYPVSSVEVDNHGVAGERSGQILQRIQEDDRTQDDIASSDIITLTLGGNDIMEVIKGNIFGLSVDSFERPLQNYQENLSDMIYEIRDLNETAGIYVTGVYNPFYVNFPEIEDMQTIIENWDNGTQELVAQEDDVYFVPINEVISQGTNDEAVINTESEDETTSSTQEENDLNKVKNNALFEEDNFHPNTIGYQLITQEVMKKMDDTQSTWLTEENAS